MPTSDAHTPKQSAWPFIAGALVLLLVFTLVLQAFRALAPSVPEEDAARAAERTKAREELEALNAERLETYAWVDKTKGTVQIPITQAMELTRVELSSRLPQPAGPLVPAPANAVPAEGAAPAANAPLEGTPAPAPAETPTATNGTAP